MSGAQSPGSALEELGFPPDRLRPVAGGDIAAAFCVQAGGRRLFFKWRDDAPADFFAAEARGLGALRAAAAVRVPEVIAVHPRGLLLEWLELRPRDDAADARLGAGLARLHAVAGPSFGFEADNYLGLTPQCNDCVDAWPEFFGRCRLAPQLELLARAGAGGRLQRRGRELLAALPDLLCGHRPAPALVHGDLWSGNAAALGGGEPVLFDPAAHWADRECDLAMARLFGGFSPSFWDAYEGAAPLPPASRDRVALYQLYHLLNHANLFGGAYRSRSLAVLEDLLAGTC